MEFLDKDNSTDPPQSTSSPVLNKAHGGDNEDFEGDGESDRDNFNDWVEDEEDNPPIKSLFDSHQFSSISSFLQYQIEKFQFDLNSIVLAKCRNSFDFIKLVNFIRHFSLTESEKSESRALSAVHLESLKAMIAEDRWMAEEFMRPVLPDDSLLFLYEEAFSFAEDDEDEAAVPQRKVDSKDEHNLEDL
eukprot:gene4493-4815_t